MSSFFWHRLEERLEANLGVPIIQRNHERVRATGEIFTPSALVVDMIRQIPLRHFGPGKTVLDPACGDGQFLVAAKWVKIFFHGMTAAEALTDIYGIDIMRDNVDLCRARLGGGTIVMGDTLHPENRLVGQTDEEHRILMEILNG